VVVNGGVKGQQAPEMEPCIRVPRNGSWRARPQRTGALGARRRAPPRERHEGSGMLCAKLQAAQPLTMRSMSYAVQQQQKKNAHVQEPRPANAASEQKANLCGVVPGTCPPRQQNVPVPACPASGPCPQRVCLAAARRAAGVALCQPAHQYHNASRNWGWKVACVRAQLVACLSQPSPANFTGSLPSARPPAACVAARSTMLSVQTGSSA